jgi:protein-S-isoprenylcysteine O-methyltransferase Ste14
MDSGDLRRQVIARSILAPAMIIILTFALAGRLDYWQGWLYNGSNLVVLAVTYVALSSKRDLIEERLRPGQGMKRWDKIYFMISSPTYFIAIAVASLDAGRFGWEPRIPLGVFVLGVAVFVAGHFLFLWAKSANKFFATVVRIQSERGQTVCKDGPYRFVRHPGYVGGILFGLGTPLILDSFWALIPAVVGAALLVVRTYLEDRTLKEELAGYLEYAHQVRYRLIPHVW